MKKIPIFIEQIYEYDLVIEEHKYTLYFSNESQWTEKCKGKICFEYNDTGNEIKFTQKQKGILDYMELSCLSIILRFISIENKEDYKFAELKEF